MIELNEVSSDVLARLVLESPGLVCVLDLEGQILFMCPKLRRLIGVSEQDDSSRSIYDFIYEPDHEITRASFEKLARGQSTAQIVNRTSSQGKRVSIEWTGISVPEEGRVYAWGRRASDRVGDWVGSPSKNSELEAIFTALPLVLWTTDLTLRFTYSGGSGLAALGLEVNEVVGWTLERFLGSPGHIHIGYHERALAGETVTYEESFGELIYRSTVRPLLDADDEIIGVLGVALDITGIGHG